jgi:hypothetical protein
VCGCVFNAAQFGGGVFGRGSVKISYHLSHAGVGKLGNSQKVHQRQLRAETMRKEVTRPNYRAPEHLVVYYCTIYSRSPQKITRKDIIPGKAGANPCVEVRE